MSSRGPKPIVKWAGGKANILPQLLALFPSKYGSYYEPFFGGGAVYFSLNPSHARINDLNDALMNLYRQLKNNENELVAGLKKIEQQYYAKNDEQRKEYFYETRVSFNAEPRDTIESAVRLIFLNRTCFNGLYRENRKGGFNVPFGSYVNPTICNEENLRQVAARLQETELTSGPFASVVKQAKAGDFIYFDPPYAPLNATSSFTSYSADDFTTKDQVELSELFKELDKRGCYVALSNSNTSLIRELYKGFKKHTIIASRNISAKGDGRSKIKELLITNY